MLGAGYKNVIRSKCFAVHDLCPASVKSLLFPVRTFFTMEGGDSEFANFKLPTLKAFLEVRSQNVSGNKQ